MKLFILLLGMTVFAYMAISACMGDTSVESAAPPKDTKAAKYKIINILTMGLDSSLKKPDIRPRCAELEFKAKEQIVWVTVPSGVEFTVEFKERTGSPFEKSVFTHEDPVSGPIVNYRDGEDKFYAYTVKVKGHDVVDPGIIIW